MSKHTQHTPGPWAFGTPGDGGRVNVYADDIMTLRICRVDSGYDGGIDVRANAKLIAAAPDMAEALHQSTQALENIAAYLVKHQHKLPPVSLTDTELQIERNRAALAKAGL